MTLWLRTAKKHLFSKRLISTYATMETNLAYGYSTAAKTPTTGARLNKDSIVGVISKLSDILLRRQSRVFVYMKFTTKLSLFQLTVNLQ